MKKAILIKNKKHYLDIEIEKAFSHGLKLAGFQVELVDMNELAENIERYKVEEYDMIAFDPVYNALFSSGRKRAHMFKELARRSKPNALTMYVCDVMLPHQPRLWDKDQSHNDKENVFNSSPIRVLASFDPSIKNDKKAMEKLNNLWMRHLHPDSTIHFIEWIPFAHYTYGKNFVEPMIDLSSDYEEIGDFYYGMKRSHIARSLKQIGFNSEKDLVYGSISKVVNDNVRKVDLPVKTPFSWVPYARVADRVAIPYEPIKSDYQITIRLLEALLFYKDKVVFDDRVNNELIKYTESIEHWKKKSQETINDIRKLYEID